MRFKNVTNPNKLPVENDIVEYYSHGRPVRDEYDLNTFEHMINIAKKEREEGFSRMEFRKLFTLAELLVIDNCEFSDSLTIEQKSIMATIKKNLEMVERIKLSDNDTVFGIDYLVSLGLLTQERANDILIGKANG